MRKVQQSCRTCRFYDCKALRVSKTDTFACKWQSDEVFPDSILLAPAYDGKRKYLDPHPRRLMRPDEGLNCHTWEQRPKR